MKHRYRVRVQVADGVEETQFVPLSAAAPRVKAIYQRDPKDHGKYKDGREYKVDPERLQAAAEEAEAEAQAEILQEQTEPMREEEKAAAKLAKKGKK